MGAVALCLKEPKPSAFKMFDLSHVIPELTVVSVMPTKPSYSGRSPSWMVRIIR